MGICTLIKICDKTASALKNALSSLEGAARGLEGYEIDVALESIASDANKFGPAAASSFNYNPDEHQQAGEAISSNAKALQAALSSLASTVKNDPKKLGAMAKLVASSYNALSDAALSAASTAPNKETHDRIVQAGREVGAKTGRAVALVCYFGKSLFLSIGCFMFH